jgi:hypothetical protein
MRAGTAPPVVSKGVPNQGTIMARESLEIDFGNPEMRDIYECLMDWIESMETSGFGIEDIIEVLHTYSLIYGYTFAEEESIDRAISDIKTKVIQKMTEGESATLH